MCAMLDFTAGFLFVGLAYSDHNNSSRRSSSSSATTTNALPTAAYLFCHGYAHYQVAVGDADESSSPPSPISNWDLVLLAGIISIGPIQAGKDLANVGVFDESHRSLLRVVSVVAVAALVMGYKIFLGNSNYALLYVNISIILTALLPRCIWIGYTEETHIQLRLDDQSGYNPYFWLRIATRIYMGSMILLEPFACGLFIREIGGHLLFDMSLFMDSFVEYINLRSTREQQQNKRTETPPIAVGAEAITTQEAENKKVN